MFNPAQKINHTNEITRPQASLKNNLRTGGHGVMSRFNGLSTFTVIGLDIDNINPLNLQGQQIIGLVLIPLFLDQLCLLIGLHLG